ncbi:MAG: adenylate/guanylate cyclase domain-containing protein [Verrucomicrobia bacterium]|nr:adenylate/guanylate cyclase domain-containing protein [Verrucomicrobiota bacterium]
MPAVIRIEREFAVPFPTREIWPVLSQTDWINRSLGLPPVTYEFKPAPAGGSEVMARARMFGTELRWREHPFEWLENEFYRVQRVFERGPFREAKLGVEFRSDGGNGAIVRVCSDFSPRNAVFAWLTRYVIGPQSLRGFASILAHVTAHLNGRESNALPRLPRATPAAEPLSVGLTKLRHEGQSAGLIEKLTTLIRNVPDVEAGHLRPLAVARAWHADAWEVLRLFLAATSAGLLDLRWEILCPNCRSSRQPPTTSLAQLERKTHCEVCQIGFDAEFDRSVELKFSIHPAVRPLDRQTFCLAGPGGKPHVTAQIVLQPGEGRSWKLPSLKAGWRLRSPQVRQATNFAGDESDSSGVPRTIECQPEEFRITFADQAGDHEEMAIVNPNPFPVQVCLERLAWSEDILTAARVTNWQEFRDLFATEVISPHEQISVGSQIVLFTDLRGSTAMYNQVGDGRAYAVVRDHFVVLRRAIQEHHGAVVKTIGDAVMAVFSQVDEALLAVKQMHASLRAAGFAAGAPPVVALKSSLHVGPCLAVNANEKLDFFGTAINFAARLVDCSKGDDLVMSDEFFQRPETRRFFLDHPIEVETIEVKFRGFEAAYRVWRVPMLADKTGTA